MEEDLKNQDELKIKNLDAHIEAVLFLKGEPIRFRKLAKMFAVDEFQIREAVDILSKTLSEGGRGIRLVKKEDEIMLATAPESSEFTRALTEEEFNSPLTKPALETLSIVVYRAPVTRADIDYIRGVNSSFILRNLLIRGLVEKIPNPRDSRGYVYKPSFKLLQYLGVQNLENLPEYGAFNEKIQDFIQENEKQQDNNNNTDNSDSGI